MLDLAHEFDKLTQEVRKIETIDDLKGFLKSLFSPDEADVFLFGSRAKGTNSETSDIDIGIYVKKDAELKVSLLKELINESNLPYKVDIVTLNGNKKYMNVVAKEGKRWI